MGSGTAWNHTAFPQSPATSGVPWDVAPAALVTAILFAIGRALIGLYLSHTATASTYGAAGSLVILLMWVYYSSMILLLGAAFSRAHCEARGRYIRARSTAVRVRRELHETPA